VHPHSVLAYDLHPLCFIQITKHWSNTEKPEMTLEKLQLIATASASPPFKVRWLEQWNSSTHSREALHFPSKGFTEKELESWLNRATFWAGVSIQSLYTFYI
jgi:hypothetical protein